ncbi:hypothetical protein OC861_001945 [Tilletia horrida]|nr:hypothetical protein OC861_001945 [Tilletia horrida]
MSFEDSLPTHRHRAHRELSPPTSPAVDSMSGADVVRSTKHAARSQLGPKQSSKSQPGAGIDHGRSTKELTPPTTAESVRTTATVRPYDHHTMRTKGASNQAQDEEARDADRSSSSSPAPRSSPTPAARGDDHGDVLGTGPVTPPGSHTRLQKGRRAAPAFPAPIRDTPNNPFIEGGPADLGFNGPFGADARIVADKRAATRVTRGRTTYVFRGQRITYEDPEYLSGDSDSDGLFGPSGLQPRLLFPSRKTPPPRSSFTNLNARSSSRASSSASSARLGASRNAQEHHVGFSQSDFKGGEVDPFFGPAEPAASRRPTPDRRAVVHADASQLIRQCDGWSSEMSEDEGHHGGAAHSSAGRRPSAVATTAGNGFEDLDRVRMDMNDLVANGEMAPSTELGSIAMARRTSSRSSSSSSRSSRSARMVQGPGLGLAGSKRKAHPMWDRDLILSRQQQQQAQRAGAQDPHEAEESGVDTTGHTFGLAHISISNEHGTKRARRNAPEGGPSFESRHVGLGLSHLEHDERECTPARS